MNESNFQWHQLSAEETLSRLDSSLCGLAFDEAERRLEEHGPNELEEGQGTSWIQIVIAQVKNPLILVLVVAAGISLLAGEEVDAIVIAGVILLNTVIGFVQEYQAERSLAALQEQAAPEAEVVRCSIEDGTEESIEVRLPSREVVPGDLILLSTGDRVPADARMLQEANLEIDESMLTGESTPVSKMTERMDQDAAVADRLNLVYGGSLVNQGRGRAVVFATGSDTEMGKIATMIQETEAVESPLQRQIGTLSRYMGLLALVVAIVTIVLGLIRDFELSEIFLFALAAAVSSIPEGLPAVMTITLAVGVNRMAKRNAIIRRLQAVDTLGAATVICTDKTGTLTTNQMTVQIFSLDHRKVAVTGVGFEPEGQFQIDGEEIDPAEDEELQLALQIGALCNDSRLNRREEEGRQLWEIRGDPTEGALIVAAAKAHHKKENLQRTFPRIDEIPFSSKTKYMVTFHELPEDDSSVRVLVKGAPERVLALSSELRQDGDTRPLDADQAQAWRDIAQEMASQGLRVLGLAYRDISKDEVEEVKRQLNDGEQVVIFQALAGMIDPARPEVPEAIDRAQRARIRVIMATGDHKLTAEAIAREIGILEEGGRVLAGDEVEAMSDEELDAAVVDTPVFARVSPEHKHRMVEALRRHGEVVAMTGDGVNDAPALKAAEIGIAMGITGTDVTKETAEMVLTDDNFASIVNAVEEGRVVFENIRKVVKLLIATNFGEILTILPSILLLPPGELIFLPVQILWVNLVTDGVLDITLALEPKEGDVMDQEPRDPNARIVNREILRNTVFVALFMAIGTLGVFFLSYNDAGIGYARTMAFTTLAMFQVFNALNCRSRDKSVFQLGFFTNPYLIAAMVVSVLLQIGVTLIPFMQTALQTTPLTLLNWITIVAVASTVFIADELRKLALRRRRQDGP
jgi:P-type Ca2+ transporter type 2C